MENSVSSKLNGPQAKPRQSDTPVNMKDKLEKYAELVANQKKQMLEVDKERLVDIIFKQNSMITQQSNQMIDHLRGLSDKLRADLLKECQESNLQKTNHNDKDDRGLITVEHVNLITSSINYDYFDRYWKMIKKCPDADELNNVAHAIVIEGYPMDYVLKFFKDKIIECDLNDIDKAEVLLFIGNVERMLINGSGNHIQTLAILTIIVSKYKGMSIRIPNIY